MNGSASTLEPGLRQSLWAAAVSVFTSSGTLLCCALPALMVSIGAGAALAGLVAQFPQLIWLSEHKTGVFGLAGAMLLLAGILQWRGRSLPCPADAKLAAACLRTRQASLLIYILALAMYITGAGFAFLLPSLI